MTRSVSPYVPPPTALDAPCACPFMLLQVGRENLVGTENGALLCMMRNLEIERVTLAAMGLGIARCEHVDTGSQRAARHVSSSAAANPSSVLQ